MHTKMQPFGTKYCLKYEYFFIIKNLLFTYKELVEKYRKKHTFFRNLFIFPSDTFAHFKIIVIFQNNFFMIIIYCTSQIFLPFTIKNLLVVIPSR